MEMPADLHDLMVNDRGFAFDPSSGDTFQFSVTGLYLFRLWQDGAEEEAVCRSLLEAYEVDEHTARRDVAQFLSTLESFGWKRPL